MKKVSVLILVYFVTLIVGCSKEKPPIGNYIGRFHYQYPSTWPDQYIWLKIEESEKDYFLIGATDYNGNILAGYDTIFKNNKKIYGRISSNDGVPYEITGEWSKKTFKKSYLLKGTFTKTYYSQGGSNQDQTSGTFEITSN